MLRSAAWIEAPPTRRAAASLAVIALATAASCTLDAQGTQPVSMTSSSGGGGEATTTTTSTGLGGMGGAGSSAGGGGAGGSPPKELGTWSGAAGPGADGTYALPSWLELSSPSTEKTVQTGPSTLRTGFGANAARGHNVTSPPAWGLALESARTNRNHSSRISAASWEILHPPGSIVATQGPDAANLAATIADTNSTGMGAAVAVVDIDPLAGTSTLSAWVGGVQAVDQVKIASTVFPSPFGVTVPLQAGWQRISHTALESTGGVAKDSLYPAQSPGSATGSASFDFVSHEAGKYPSSAILTSGAAATREAEALVASGAATLAPGGYFHVTLVFAPSYASGEQAGAHTLLFFDALNRVVLDALNRVVLMVNGMPAVATATLSWKRDQALTVEVVNAPTEQRITVSGHDTGGGSASAPTGTPVGLSTEIGILGGAAGSEECADLRSIRFEDPTP